MTQKNRGISLLEILIFILIFGILGAVIPKVLFLSSQGIGNTFNNIDAYNMATSRLQIALGQRAINGFSTVATTLDICCDPNIVSGTATGLCNGGLRSNAPAVCGSIPLGYTITTTITSPPPLVNPPPALQPAPLPPCYAASPIGNNANYACITVTVTGPGTATVSALESNY